MTSTLKTLAAIALAAGFGSAAFAQEDSAPDMAGDLVGITCQHFLDADAATQHDYTTAMVLNVASDVTLDAQTQADVDTLDNNVRAVAAICGEEGNADMSLFDVRDALMASGVSQ